jgi:hypothetical protein
VCRQVVDKLRGSLVAVGTHLHLSEEFHELLASMPRGRLALNLARQHRIQSVQCFDGGFLIHRNMAACWSGFRYKPIMSAAVRSKSGSSLANHVPLEPNKACDEALKNRGTICHVVMFGFSGRYCQHDFCEPYRGIFMRIEYELRSITRPFCGEGHLSGSRSPQ